MRTQRPLLLILGPEDFLKYIAGLGPVYCQLLRSLVVQTHAVNQLVKRIDRHLVGRQSTLRVLVLLLAKTWV